MQRLIAGGIMHDNRDMGAMFARHLLNRMSGFVKMNKELGGRGTEGRRKKRETTGPRDVN